MGRASKTRLEVATSPNRVMRPKQKITCTLRIVTSRPIQVNEWWAEFRGEVRSMPFDHAYASAVTSYPVGMAQINALQTHQTVCMYLGRQRSVFKAKDDGGSPLHILGGNYAPGPGDAACVVFTITLPEKAPDTWRGNKGKNGSVKYVLNVKLRYKKLDKDDRVFGREKTINRELEIVIKNTCDAMAYILHGPASNSAMKFIGLPGHRGQVNCELSLAHRDFMLGETLGAEVDIVNQSSWTLEVSLSLFQEFIFTDSTSATCPINQQHRVEEKIRQVWLPRVEPGGVFQREVLGLLVPESCLISGSLVPTACIMSRFFVRLKAKWRPKGALLCDVTLYIGTHRSAPRDDDPVPPAPRFPQYISTSLSWA